MEHFLKEILGGNKLFMGFAIVALLYSHNEAMGKLDKLNDSLVEIAKTSAVYGEKFKAVDKRVNGIEAVILKLQLGDK